MKQFVRFSTAAVAAAIAAVVQQSCPVANAQYFPTVDDAYNPNEERGSFELVMKPYPIPIKTTTYVDFFFNLPEDLPELFHVTYGEVIVSQPQHLHHFVVTGCPEKIDPSEDGMPGELDTMGARCTKVIGGWAPGGDVFGNTDLDTGILLGRALGYQALQLNVHYTDGVYADEALKTPKMATDGIRVHYTPAFRPYTSVPKPLIDISTAPLELQVPPGESRFYVSRTCNVDTNCKDASQDNLDFMSYLLGGNNNGIFGEGFSCESAKPLCNMGGEFGPYILKLCPSTCGLCEKGTDGNVNPLNPDTYRITDIQYHAHLLGREMYTTLLQDQEESETIATDLESRDFWLFDFQETIPFDFNLVQNDKIMRGMEIKAGDRIQVTCVYDSTYETDPTRFFLSTYDEMCITNTRVAFETPASLLNGDEIDATSSLDLATELNLMSFSCVDDARGDIYTGILTADEDGRDIWKDHPIDKAEGCTFVTSDLKGGELTNEVRNCGSDFGGICGPGVELSSEITAGATCIGGTFDQKDANLVTETDCENGGGSYSPYSCQDINTYLKDEAEMDQSTMDFLIGAWWKPKCCNVSIDENLICGPDTEFFPRNIAGATCEGGTLDQSNRATEKQCTDGGGVYEPYTCEESNSFLKYDTYSMDQATIDLLVNLRWKPNCCGDSISESSSKDEAPGIVDLDDSSPPGIDDLDDLSPPGIDDLDDLSPPGIDDLDDLSPPGIDAFVSDPVPFYSAAIPGVANSPTVWLSVVSVAGILSIVVWG